MSSAVSASDSDSARQKELREPIRDSQEACVHRHDERVTRLVATRVFWVP